MDKIKVEYRGKVYYRVGREWYSDCGEKKPQLDKVLNEKLIEVKNQNLWVGKLDKDTVVFNKEIPPVKNKVPLWFKEENRFYDLDRNTTREKISKTTDKEAVSAILEEYRKSTVVRHRLKLQSMGREYLGVKVSERKTLRVTTCWACKHSITSDHFPECLSCGWILCSCGACGCGSH